MIFKSLIFDFRLWQYSQAHKDSIIVRMVKLARLLDGAVITDKHYAELDDLFVESCFDSVDDMITFIEEANGYLEHHGKLDNWVRPKMPVQSVLAYDWLYTPKNKPSSAIGMIDVKVRLVRVVHRFVSLLGDGKDEAFVGRWFMGVLSGMEEFLEFCEGVSYGR